MINKNYFRQLIRSNRYLLAFIAGVELFFCATNIMSKDGYIFTGGNMFLSVVLVFALPMVIFSYVHDRKAIDVYGSLPLTRKELLETGLFFCILAVLVPAGVAMIVNYLFGFSGVVNVSFFELIKEWCVLNFGFVTLIVFNAALFLLGNSLFDGVVMVGAYTFMPIALYFTVVALLNTFIYGYNIESIDILCLISPISALISLYAGGERTWLFGAVELENEILYLASLFVFLTVSFVLLQKTFAKRKLERAGNASDGFFAYPFVTHCYMIICLFIATSLVYENGTGFSFNAIRDYLLVYILIFVAYVVAHFVQKRRFYISVRSIAFYFLCIILTLSFGYSAMKTRGFGLTYRYDLKSENFRYAYNNYKSDDDELLKYLAEEGIETEFAGVMIYADSTAGQPLDKEAADFFEDIRSDSIERHYEKHQEYRDAYMQVYDGFNNSNVYNYRYDRHYSYNDCKVISLEELKWLSYKQGIYIGIDTSNGIYGISDGQLVYEGYEYRY